MSANREGEQVSKQFRKMCGKNTNGHVFKRAKSENRMQITGTRRGLDRHKLVLLNRRNVGEVFVSKIRFWNIEGLRV